MRLCARIPAALVLFSSLAAGSEPFVETGHHLGRRSVGELRNDSSYFGPSSRSEKSRRLRVDMETAVATYVTTQTPYVIAEWYFGVSGAEINAFGAHKLECR